jgi:DNA-directed RNA polymerase specialized sigma24 family protein
MNHSKFEGFATTNWSLVLAVMDTTPARASDALEQLCGRYWFPVYASIRRLGNDVQQAEDLTQGFFEFAIEQRLLQRAQRDRGRFRSFILTSLNNFLHNHHDRATAAKRGGRCGIVRFDEADAEKILASEPIQTGAPGDSFDRRWAVTLIRRVTENLQAEFVKRGRTPVYEALRPFLSGEPSPGDYDRIATALGMETGTLRVALHRFRHRFGELLRREVAYTVADPAEVEEEIRYLLSVLAGE